MRYRILLGLVLIFASCGDYVTDKIDSSKSENNSLQVYTNNLDSFKDFTKEFEVIIADSARLSSINKSDLSYAELQTNNFIDTNGLVKRIPNKGLFGGREYELNSYFEFNTGDEVFESSIIYYFNYDSTSKSFVIVDMMMAS